MEQMNNNLSIVAPDTAPVDASDLEFADALQEQAETKTTNPTEKTWLQELAKKMDVPYIDITQYALNENVSKILPEGHARRFRAILLAEEDNQYLLGMADPLDIFAADELQHLLKKPLKFVLVSEKDLLYKLDQLYRRTGEITSFADKLALELQPIVPEGGEEQAIRQAEPAVIQLLNSVFADAIQVGASDIHIEPAENILRIRQRVDGLLQEQIISIADKRHIPLAVAQRIKLMGGLNIAEKRLPQDGRISLRLGTRAVDVRVSTLPSAHGERAVLRLLDKSEARLTLEAVGMQGRVLQQVDQLISQPHGILLVTGPTGSGKTTSLYAALQRLDATRNNIMTVEDPIEYELPGVGQTQVNAKIDLTFAKALRAILRQDPDVIMIGEIRDFETAQIAIQASLTGHLVLATLHTNDAVSAVTRLTDMGVEPFLLSSSLLGVLAQRLVRKSCTACQGVGCDACGHTGYSGRTGIFELLVASDEIRGQIHNHAAESELRATALQQGMVMMREDGQRLVDSGITRSEELLRVTRD
jgi:general secretion pathway protein E